MMGGFDTKALPSRPDVTAPDGTDVRILCALKGGGFAHFELQPGQTSIAVAHRTVEEIWYIVGGHGEMWRRQGDQEMVVTLDPGLCLTIPLGCSFQLRAASGEPLRMVAVTMPPWPGPDEAVAAEGPWAATVASA